MRKLLLVLPISMFFVLNIAAQVVNTEAVRFTTNEKKWIGDFDFSFGLNRTKAGETLNLRANGNLQYKKGSEKWMLLSGYSLVQFLNIDDPGAVPKNFNNAQYIHLRYNRRFKGKTIWEVFVQEQWDEIHEIEVRLLGGTGPRFELMETDSSQIYFGALYMFEYENTGPMDSAERNRDHRLSTYLSLGFNFSKFIVNHIMYYQPNLERFSDYRINSESSIAVQIDKRISLRTSFTYIFDSKPPATVRKTRFNLSSGIRLEF